MLALTTPSLGATSARSYLTLPWPLRILGILPYLLEIRAEEEAAPARGTYVCGTTSKLVRLCLTVYS